VLAVCRRSRTLSEAGGQLFGIFRSREGNQLLVEADDQNRADMEALAGALRRKNAVALKHVAVNTDHTFSDHRIALQTIVIEWLQELK
jgi:hypothetical protein